MLKLTIPLTLLLAAPAGAKITYDDDVLPIFEQACLNCHNPDKSKGGLDLSSFSATLKGGSGGKVVEPNDRSSTLLSVVRQTSEPKMPPESDPLSSTHIEIISSWIEGGLLENRSSPARKPSKPKFDTTIRSNPSSRPDGPPPMPKDVLLEPVVVAPRGSTIHSVACSPWAPLLAATSQRQVLLFHTESFELLGILPFPEGDPISLAFTPDGKYLIVGGGVPGKSGRTVTFDVTNGDRVLAAAREFDSVITADLHPSLDQIATGSPSRLIKIWKTEGGAQFRSIKKHTDWVTSVDFSPDGILLGTGDRNGGVWVWESESGNEFHTLRAHQAGITSLAFRADSNVLATASEDGTVRFWEMNQGKEIKKLDAHPGGVLAFSWARDGSFATAGRNKTARLWKSDFGQLRKIEGLKDIPTAIALDAEGTRVFIGDYHGVITVHDAQKGVLLGQMDTNPPAIEARLETIEKRISKQTDIIAKQRKRISEVESRVTLLRKRMTEAGNAVEATARSARSAELKLEEAEKLDPPDPGQQSNAVASLKAAHKERSDATHRLTKLRKTLESVEKALQSLVSETKKAEPTITDLQIRQRHWKAAQINAQSMDADQLANRLNAEAEELGKRYTQAAHTFEDSRNKLSRKLLQRAEVSAQLGESDAQLASELKAVLAALDAVISQQIQENRKLEEDLLELRAEADQQLPEAAEARLRASSLKKAYFAEQKAAP